MQNRASRASLFLFALLVPSLLFAQVPSAVTNIRATALRGTITVRWDAPAEQNISYYRVYYSSRSILENGGVYDDFEATPGPETTYVLQYKPTGQTLYISVLAVNDQGIEGEVFVEEAVVMMDEGKKSETPIMPVLKEQPSFTPPQENQNQETPGTETFTVATEIEQREPEESSQTTQKQIREQVESLPQWEARGLGGALHLLLTDVLSPTEVQLLFSAPPFVEPEYAPQAFTIVDSDGNPLRIESVFIDQEKVLINTEVQVRGKEYEVRLSEPLRGADNSPLHTVNRRGSFRGHPEGREEELTQDRQSVLPPQQGEGQTVRGGSIRNLHLTSSSLLDGTFTVRARWDIDNPFGDLAYYSIRQSLDGGKTLSEPQVLPLNINGVDVPGIMPGEYGISVSALSVYGYATPEVFASIHIGPQEPPPPPQAPSPSQPLPTQQPQPEPMREMIEGERESQAGTVRHVNAGKLAQSGTGIVLGTLGTLGMLIGWRRAQRAMPS